MEQKSKFSSPTGFSGKLLVASFIYPFRDFVVRPQLWVGLLLNYLV